MKKRILIIDDDKDFSETLQENLERSGEFDVRTLNYSPRAVSVSTIVRPDLMIVDLTMPDHDGQDVLRQLGNHRWLSSIPVIICTGMGNPPNLQTFPKQVKKLFTKPIQLNTLQQEIRRLLNETAPVTSDLEN